MYNLPWRKDARKKLKNLVGKMTGKWAEIREQDKCNSQMMRKGGEVEEINDDLERTLNAQCKVWTKPVRKLAQDAKSWSEKYNGVCGNQTHRDPQEFRTRSWNTILKIRKQLYCRLGCKQKGCKTYWQPRAHKKICNTGGTKE